MDCPKCGVTQADGTAECQSCGILFSKLQPRAPRLTRETPIPVNPEPQSHTPVILIMVGVLIFGMFWMAHRRKTRNEPAVDLDALNHQQVMLQMAAREKRDTDERNQRLAQVAEERTMPLGLTKEAVTEAIERCPAFRNPTAMTLRRVSRLGNFSKSDTAFTISIAWEQFATDNESRALATGDAIASFEGSNGNWRLKILRDSAGGTLCE